MKTKSHPYFFESIPPIFQPTCSSLLFQKNTDLQAMVICSYRLLYSKVYRQRLLDLAGSGAVSTALHRDEDSPATSTPSPKRPRTRAPRAPDAAALRSPVDLLNLRRNTRRFREDVGCLRWGDEIKERVLLGWWCCGKIFS